MIEEVQTLWKQMNGPQAVAFVRSIFRYFKEHFDTQLQYLNDLNIATANEEHLDFIGTLMGVKRPFVQNELRFAKLLKFSDTFLNTDLQGFGIQYTSEDDYGGLLDSAENFTTGISSEVLSVEDYRYVLQVLSESEGALRSLQLIDSVAYKFLKPPVVYTLSYHPTIPGDIIITLSVPSAYRALLTQIVLKVFFYSAPQIHIMTEGQS